MNPKKIAWRDQAKAQLRAIDQPTALRILHALAAFAATGDGDVKRLQGIEPPEFRLRVGDYRLRFHDLGHTLYVSFHPVSGFLQKTCQEALRTFFNATSVRHYRT